MHITVVQVVATSIAFLAQFSRIFAATKPFWGKLPAAVQVWFPPLLPFVAALQAQLSAGVVSWTDLAVAVLVSSALLLPGAPSNRSAAPLQAAKTFVPPITGLMLVLLTLVLACGLPGCSLFGPGGSVWPAVARCAPSKDSLVTEAARVLLDGGDYEHALEQLAVRNGGAAVECAVQAAIDALLANNGKLGASAGSGDAVARGKAFLKSTGTKLEVAP